jgi:signal transduction histidine kinase
VKNYFKFLKDAYVFRGLEDHEIVSILESCHEQSYKPREVIFKEGDRAERFFIVLEGEVEVWKDYDDPERDLLAVHGRGKLFGEMALIDDLPRSATVVARDSCRLLFIERDDFHRIIRETSSIALSIMKSVSLMVRKSNESFVENLRAQNHALENAYKELKETQEELLRAERLSTLGKFSSLILHDIRNPISILRGYAEMMLLHSQDGRRVKRSAGRIIGEADRLNRITNELLDYSRGEIRLNMQIVGLEDFLKQVVESIGERFKARQIEIKTEIAFKSPVLMDVDRMRRVFLNLADNARKAMPKGGTFSMKVFEQNGSFVFEVSDTGVGMSEEVKERIFEPFFSSSESGGTGLGMSIVRSIVEAHQGSLTVSTAKYKGTTFRIVLPQFN